MTSSGRNVHEVGFDVGGNHSQSLYHVDYQQRIVSTSGPPNPLEVGAKARGVLDLADGHDSCSTVNQLNELINIDATLALFTNTHLHPERISDAQPGIKIRRKLMTEGDQVIAGLPPEAIGHS